MRAMGQNKTETVARALDTFQIELPSWGFANTGTRFGKFLQPAAATTVEEKLSDAGQVHRLTGVSQLPCTCNGTCQAAWMTCPVAALAQRMEFAPAPSIRICFRIRNTSTARSAIPTRRCAERRSEHVLESVEIARRVGQPRHIAVVCRWLELSRDREHSAAEALVPRRACARLHAALDAEQRMLVEYKPFEPAFYHTDIADWGMALLLARSRGAAREGARRYRPSLSVAEHRADRGLAARLKACSADSISTTAVMRTTT